MQVDLHGTNIGATAAETARIRQRMKLLSISRRSEDRADRAGDGGLITVPATAAEDRAGIHARSATDAIQRPTKIFAAENVAAAIVEHHDMQFAARLRSVEMRAIGRNRLTGRRPRQQPQKDSEMLGAWNEFFDSHAGDMHRWK